MDSDCWTFWAKAFSYGQSKLKNQLPGFCQVGPNTATTVPLFILNIFK